MFGQCASPVSDGRPLAVPPIIGMPAAVIVSAIAFSAVESWMTMPTTPSSISWFGGRDRTLAGAQAVGGGDLDRVAVDAAHLGVDPLGPGVGNAVGHAVGEAVRPVSEYTRPILIGVPVGAAGASAAVVAGVSAAVVAGVSAAVVAGVSSGAPWWRAQPSSRRLRCPTRWRCRHRCRRRRRMHAATNEKAQIVAIA